MSTLLLYNLAGNPAMKALLQKTDTRAVYVSPADFGRPLGSFLGLPGNPDSAEKDFTRFSDPMLVFCGFDDAALDTFLRLLREAHLSVPLKAALTEHNLFWSSSHLWRELSAEHRYFAAKK